MHKMCMQHQCIYTLHHSREAGTFQEVTMDSLGAGVIKTGRIYAPNCCRHCQEAPKRIPATPAVFLRFFVCFLWRGGVWGGLGSFQVVCCGGGALKDKKHAGGV